MSRPMELRDRRCSPVRVDEVKATVVASVRDLLARDDRERAEPRSVMLTIGTDFQLGREIESFGAVRARLRAAGQAPGRLR